MNEDARNRAFSDGRRRPSGAEPRDPPDPEPGWFGDEAPPDAWIVRCGACGARGMGISAVLLRRGRTLCPACAERDGYVCCDYCGGWLKRANAFFDLDGNGDLYHEHCLYEMNVPQKGADAE